MDAGRIFIEYKGHQAVTRRLCISVVFFLVFAWMLGPVGAQTVKYTVTDLGTLPGGTQSDAVGLNDNEQVVGYAYTSGGVQHAFLYSGGSMQDLGTLGGKQVYANAINDSGQVVGGITSSDGSRFLDAFLYSNGAMQDLNTLLPSSSGWTLESAQGINDSGQSWAMEQLRTGIPKHSSSHPSPSPPRSSSSALLRSVCQALSDAFNDQSAMSWHMEPTISHGPEPSGFQMSTTRLPSYCVRRVFFYFWLFVLPAAVVFPGSLAVASNSYWGVSSGDWSAASNWGGSLPLSNNTAYIVNGGTALVTTINATCGTLSLGSTAGSGNLQVTDGGLLTSWNGQYVGYSGTGNLVQTGGSNNVGYGYGLLYLGYQTGGLGTYTLSGTGLLSGPGEVVGFSGAGIFDQSGGSNNLPYGVDLTLGYNSGGVGTYNLSGNGLFSGDSATVGYSGTGNFNQFGGNVRPVWLLC